MGVDHSYRYVKIPANPEDALVNMFDMNIATHTKTNAAWSISATVGDRYFVAVFNGSYNTSLTSITCTSGADVVTSSTMVTISAEARKCNLVVFIVTATATTMTFSGSKNTYGGMLFYSKVSSNFNGTMSTITQTTSSNKTLPISITSTKDQIYIISSTNVYWSSHVKSIPIYSVLDGAIQYNNYMNTDNVALEDGAGYCIYPTVTICKATGTTIRYTGAGSYGSGCTVLQLTSY